ncbi:MAG: lipoate-protein ligase B [Candidatus Latescibacterota bacterium]|jgi:lipoate-protein ligase B
MRIYRTGRTDYDRAHRWQKAMVERRFAGEIGDVLLLLEHSPTYTCGRATQPEHLPNKAALEAYGARLIEIERGGSITYHGPGQLVGYPIVDLRARGRDVHRYLRDLEEVLMATLATFSLHGVRRAGLTGVWVGDEKVAAIGIYVTRWISSHGFSLNISPDLEPFRAMRPCGLDGSQVNSLEGLLGRRVERAEVEEALLVCMQKVFGPCIDDGQPFDME